MTLCREERPIKKQFGRNRISPHHSSIQILLAFAWLMLFSLQDAVASTREVCFRLEFRDERVDCPQSLSNGVRRHCNVGSFATYRTPVGLRIQLWDKDGTGTDASEDELIGTWRIANEGEQCITFEWENSPASLNELHPDIYVKSLNSVRADTNGALIKAYGSNDQPFPDLSWRNTSAVADNCDTGNACNINPNMVFASDPDTATGRMIQGLDTSQRALVPFSGSIGIESVPIELHFVNGDGNAECGFITRGCTHDMYQITLAENGAIDGMTPNHELGHLFQMREFNQDYLRNDCAGSHSMNSLERDSCAVAEGWANYVAVVSWWDPENTSSRPDRSGYEIEEPNPEGTSCSNASMMEVQTTRGFWDLDDANDENQAGEATGDDLTTFSTTLLLNIWNNFADGTGNRDDYENDPDGVNAYDYAFNGGFSAAQSETFIEHNCLTAQDP